jgi:DNA-binding protein H-NS
MARAARSRRQKSLPEPETDDIHNLCSSEEKDTAMASPDVADLPEPELLTLMEENLYRLEPSSLTRLEQLVRETRDAKQVEARQTARNRALELFSQVGVSVEEVFPEFAKSTTQGGSLPPLYCGPNGELWTGRGHLPKWLKALEESNYKKELFKIRPADGTTQWEDERRTQLG